MRSSPRASSCRNSCKASRVPRQANRSSSASRRSHWHHDLEGVAALQRELSALQQRGRKLVLFGAGPLVAETFDSAGIDQLIMLAPDRQAAMAAPTLAWGRPPQPAARCGWGARASRLRVRSRDGKPHGRYNLACTADFEPRQPRGRCAG
ncbi:STAS domain-containing protein [Aquabacterium sp.]|uniref:STAS domain-containing protein n=1 Tax=Aquabacterium sp. TaxID=1872578 RepID=UPI0037838194